MEENKADISHEEIKNYYDTVYYSSVSETIAPTVHYLRLADRLAISTNHKVLDIACGTGSWLMATEAKGAKTFGVDISQKAIDVCKTNMPHAVFHCGTAESLPFETDQFDFISCLGALEHFLEPTSALGEMVRVGKDNARFLILVPNADFITSKLGLYRGTNQADVKEDVRSLEEWERLFADAGLIVDKKWRDLHILNWRWINKGSFWQIPIRLSQALLLLIVPLKWQYQVYFLCRKK